MCGDGCPDCNEGNSNVAVINKTAMQCNSQLSVSL